MEYSRGPWIEWQCSRDFFFRCGNIAGLLYRYRRNSTYLRSTCSDWYFFQSSIRCTYPFCGMENYETAFLRWGSSQAPFIRKLICQHILVEIEYPGSTWVEGTCLLFPFWERICKNITFVVGEDGKVSSWDVVDPWGSCSEGEGTTLSGVHVRIFTKFSEIGNISRICVGVVSSKVFYA